jgi:hypothetical protein
MTQRFVIKKGLIRKPLDSKDVVSKDCMNFRSQDILILLNPQELYDRSSL